MNNIKVVYIFISVTETLHNLLSSHHTLCLSITAVRLIKQTLYASLDKQSKIKLSN